MIEKLAEIDRELFLLLNKLHAAWLDPFMVILSTTWVWIPLHIFLLYHIIKNYRLRSWLVIVGLALTILLADRITSGVMKPYFERPRPSWEPELESVIHLVNGVKGGRFGFASSHAANTFGAATFLILLFRNRMFKWLGWLMLWPVLVSYTRIYLGLHYPGDIIAGSIVGVLCGAFSFWIYTKLSALLEKQKTPSMP